LILKFAREICEEHFPRTKLSSKKASLNKFEDANETIVRGQFCENNFKITLEDEQDIRFSRD